MFDNDIDRRNFLRWLLGGVSMAALDWSVFPKGSKANTGDNEFDAVIIGSGLGGLSCAAAFARQGFKPVVLEMHDRPGGYASTFKRRGFTFDVSLHSTVVGERDGIRNLIPGCDEITDVEFVPHTPLFRTIFPEHDIRVPQKDVAGYMKTLESHFPDAGAGIAGIFGDMKGLTDDINRYSAAAGKVDMANFPAEFPHLFKCFNKTWGDMVDEWIEDPKLKAIMSSVWSYYGLPPSKVSSFYYAMPTYGYLSEGGYYPIGQSQAISQALVKFITDHGGQVVLRTPVKKILTKDHTAYGVVTESGEEYKARVVVSNANANDTFRTMMNEDDHLADYLNRMKDLSVSLSCFQVFLGLSKDLVGETGIEDSEIFVETGYDIEAAYQSSLAADAENSSLGLTLYDNVYDGYSPQGKNTVNILALQGYDHWEQYEKDYLAGNKTAYNAEKERMAEILISRIEKRLLPGLSDAIEVKEVGTPLTNVRYTRNYRGAIYGWDQTMDNSGQTRVGHDTPIKKLYLSGAWTRPGHGYSAVLHSGVQCFKKIMKEW